MNNRKKTIEATKRPDTIPRYKRRTKTWKVFINGSEETGDILYVCSEFVHSGLYFPFKSSRTKNADYQNHEHSFDGVLKALLNDAEHFSIDGYEEYYSDQERELLMKIKKRLIEMQQQTLGNR